ncbi:MAG: hypothetical protein LBI65_01305 [Candidatus Symbiothrix sp.]|jgi:hypothetical protein|nr:hypothetical protein [Candidatus Symbiothrix sp.]
MKTQMNNGLTKGLLLFIAIVWMSGCTPPDNGEIQPDVKDTKSRILFKSANGTDADTVAFTGDDILWFNETTMEIRFKENIAQRNKINAIPSKILKVCLKDDFLFALNFVSEIDPRIYDTLVLYYILFENRFFLKDGYPDVSVLKYPEKSQALRDENKRKIADKWNIFIEQLKKEEKYIK